MGQDFWIVVQWWATLFLVGVIAFPLTRRLFEGWWDDGYLFAKAVGMAVVSYLVYLAGNLRIFPFTTATIWVALAVVFGGGLFITRRTHSGGLNRYKVVVLEELFFFLALLFWSWIKGHEPSIHALEKFMDFGFTKSILNSTFFPAADMWYAGSSINYYYFGHVVLATLTKLSGLDLAYTFNLMLAAIFSLTLTMSFSIGYHIAAVHKFVSGLLTAFLVTLAGNLQTIYAFTSGYTGDPAGGPPPFWQLGWSLEGLTKYWYANATRFIPFTIHEFPSYSFVVSDVHGHVLSLPFVLLAIAIFIQVFTARDSLTKIVGRTNTTFLQESLAFLPIIFYGFLVAVLLMTNALDGPIYLGLLLIMFGISQWKQWSFLHWKQIGTVVLVAGITSLPFLVHFKSFVSGVGVNCPPAPLANMKIGLFLFEGVEKCQHSPIWMLLLLWGFFLYCGMWLMGHIFRVNTKISQKEKILLVFFIFSIGLIVFPEFFYFKDIYPAHFRSNTMFKLGYQAFILFSIVSAYTIMTVKKKIFYLFLAPLLFFVSIYPVFSVRSYFNSLKAYEGINGLEWFARAYPDDYAAVSWLNAQMAVYHLPPGVLVEIDGDSYTDSARFSAFTGMPAVIGWPVHEWLWRGSYDVVSPRRADVRRIYESDTIEEIKNILAKYNVRYVLVGTLERNAYPGLVEEKFLALGKVVFRSGTTVIYEIQGY